MAQTITIENNAKLERLLTTSPDMDTKVRRITRRALAQAQKKLQGVAMPFSTKEAYKAVRKAVYKKVIGGNLNIISPNRCNGNRAPLPPVIHRLETETNRAGNHRGGNRIPRSSRTEDLLTYMGEDRGFILRFLTDGTAQRANRYGNRGSITGNNWFANTSRGVMEWAAGEIDRMLDQLIAEEFNQ